MYTLVKYPLLVIEQKNADIILTNDSLISSNSTSTILTYDPQPSHQRDVIIARVNPIDVRHVDAIQWTQRR